MAGEPAQRLARRHRGHTTGSILDGLHVDGWAVFHDVRWPGTRRTVDHVVVGPPGVFVIDSKNWSGRIEVRENSFWCRGRRQDRVIGASSEAALGIAGVLGGPASATVRSVLCFERDEPVVGWCYDVMLCSTSNLREMLTRRPQMLTPDEITLASIELDLAFRSTPPSPPRAERPERTPRIHARRQPRPSRGEPMASRWLRRWLLRLGVLLVLALLVTTQLPRLADFRDSMVDKVRHALAPEELVHDLGYDSCDAVRAIYPNGVGTAEAVHKLKGNGKRPAVQPEVYRASATLDKDGDGVVCERGR
jgi:hypothetical protein